MWWLDVFLAAGGRPAFVPATDRSHLHAASTSAPGTPLAHELARTACGFLLLSTTDRFKPRQDLAPTEGADCCNGNQLLSARNGLLQFPVVNRLITHSQQASKVWRGEPEAAAQGSKAFRNEAQRGRGRLCGRGFGRFRRSLRKQPCLSLEILDLTLQGRDLTSIG